MTLCIVVHSGPSLRTVVRLIVLSMATMAWINPPAVMRLDATLVRGIPGAPLALVHVGQSAVVLRDQATWDITDTLVILTAESSGLMPGGACLCAEDFFRVREEILACETAGNAAVLRGWDGRSTSVEPTDLVLHETHISPESALAYERALQALPVADAVAASVMSPERVRRSAPALAQQAVDGRVRSEALRSMVGAGPGTTPSGDDVIVGVLAGLRALGLRAEADLLGHDVTPLLSTTTAASRHYLSAAIDGRFGEHVHHLVAALADGESPECTLRRAGEWGATSGTDLLVGLVATLVTSLTNTSIGSAA